MQWINVNNRLPLKGERILFAVAGGFVGEGYLNENNKWVRYGSEYNIEAILGDVVFWCEMPKCETERAYH
jgi:hypothetical protein